jgi:hypothetical protein
MPTVVQPKRKKPAARQTGKVQRRKAPAPRKAAAPRKQPAKATPRVADSGTTWAELAGKAGPVEARKRERQSGFVDAVPTLRFAAILALLCAALTLYVGHLYSSQSLVEDVQELRKEQQRLALQQNRLRGEYDRLTAPAVILERAAALGLNNSGDYAATIILLD